MNTEFHHGDETTSLVKAPTEAAFTSRIRKQCLSGRKHEQGIGAEKALARGACRGAARVAFGASLIARPTSFDPMAKLAQLGKLAQLAELEQLGKLVQPMKAAALAKLRRHLPVLGRWRDAPNGTDGVLCEVPNFEPDDFLPKIYTRLMVLQATPFCNLDCDYCYLPDRRNSARMSMDVLRRALERLRDDQLLGPELTLAWHAGEPTAAPIQFYEKAFDLASTVLGPDCIVTHAFQTNATLISDDWCALMAKHRVKVGVSIDGPAWIHDRHRRYLSGKGSHAHALRGIARLRDHGIEFHAIAVVTERSLAAPEEFFEFFVKLGVSELGCNFDVRIPAIVITQIAAS